MKRFRKLTALLLTAAMLAGLCACSLLPSSEKGGLPAPDRDDPKTVSGENREDGSAGSGETGEEGEILSFSMDELDEKANESASLWEFFQSLAPNMVIYKDSAGKFNYQDINEDLPLHSWNFDNLVRLDKGHKEMEYREGGKTVSVKGIDVSLNQGSIDWDKVAADGVEFAIIRVGYRGWGTGKFKMDERFEEYMSGALRAGIEVGVYFVTQAISVEEGIEEAEYVLEAIKPYNVTWPVVIDIEPASSDEARTAGLTRDQRTDYAVAFCDRIAEAGYTPSIYCSISWFVDRLDIARIAPYDKWLAQYFSRPYFPYDFQIWQYTNTGKVDGIKGNVDLDLALVDYSQR